MTAPAGPQDKPAYRWLVLTAATAAQATASFALLGLAALAGFLQRDFNLTAAETGLLITASYAAPLFSLLFVGDLLDRKSERLIIGIGAVVLFVPFLFAAASRHLPRCCSGCSSPGSATAQRSPAAANRSPPGFAAAASGLPWASARRDCRSAARWRQRSCPRWRRPGAGAQPSSPAPWRRLPADRFRADLPSAARDAGSAASARP